MQVYAGTAHGEVAVPYTSERYQFVGEFLDLLGIAANNNNLQTVVMIHMDMCGGDYLVVMVVLRQKGWARGPAALDPDDTTSSRGSCCQ